MVIKRNIWSVAIWLVAKHGAAASTVVSARITRLREEDADNTAIDSWLLVDEAVHELVRAPAKNEMLN
jgi:hypothetical protein